MCVLNYRFTVASVATHTLTLTGSYPTWTLFGLSFAPDNSGYTLYASDLYSSWYSVSLRDNLDFKPNQLFIGKVNADDFFATNTVTTIDDLLMWNYELSSSDFLRLYNSYA